MSDSSLDSLGVYGNLFSYALAIFFVGGAFLVFLYLWKKGRLDMDEGPKWQMMQEDKQKEQDNELI